MLSTLELHCAGRAGVLSVTTEMVEGARASWEDIEGMVNWARNVEGVQVGVLLTTAKGGGVRVSMRSRSEKIDVGKVCMTLGGGGHPGAGGCHINSDPVTTKERVVKALDARVQPEPPRDRARIRSDGRVIRWPPCEVPCLSWPCAPRAAAVVATNRRMGRPRMTCIRTRRRTATR